MGDILQIHAPLVTVYSEADLGAEPSNVLLYGESVETLEEHGEWVKARSLHDAYEGFIRAALLSHHSEKNTKICVPASAVYETPDFKTEARHPLYFGSCVHATTETQNGFVKLANQGWIFQEHLMKHDVLFPDIVDTAHMFLNAPYVWGGRSVAGLDCSGLVQMALMAADVPCPRDTSEQINAIGVCVDGENLQRGDFVFFERHVGIMVDEAHILNTTSRHMRTLIEPLSDLIESYNGILAVRRLA